MWIILFVFQTPDGNRLAKENGLDDALVGWGSFVQARYLCVLVHVWVEGEVGAVRPVWALR